MQGKNRFRLKLLAALLVITPLGVATKFYSGLGGAWVNTSAGDLLYPAFLMFILVFFLPTLKPRRAAVAVFLFSTAVEFSQLLDGPFWCWMRQSFLGRTLVGVSFVELDILYYAAGCLLGIVLLNLLRFPAAAPEPDGQ